MRSVEDRSDKQADEDGDPGHRVPPKHQALHQPGDGDHRGESQHADAQWTGKDDGRHGDVDLHHLRANEAQGKRRDHQPGNKPGTLSR
ncbi:hypothetical protein [Variovorax sp. GT1P44]|uniref:hypothetical protein n=1 Tax=Variovorax sp. GT1P44 TaxID=3443742 RepID=UPI003F48A0A0